jgi:hypothetical protein
MNIMEKINLIIGGECGHGSVGLPVKEVINAVELDIANEQARVCFESGDATNIPMETFDELLDSYEESGYAQVQYNPWKCSITNRSGMLEELTLY